MSKESITLYKSLISHRFIRTDIVNLLGKEGWVRNPDASIKKFGSSIQRQASVLSEKDLIQFDVGDRGLERVLIQAGVPVDGSRQEFLSRWAALKATVTRELGRPGISEDCSEKWMDQRCIWPMGEVEVSARATRPWYRWTVEFDIHRRKPATESLASSLEDLFVM